LGISSKIAKSSWAPGERPPRTVPAVRHRNLFTETVIMRPRKLVAKSLPAALLALAATALPVASCDSSGSAGSRDAGTGGGSAIGGSPAAGAGGAIMGTGGLVGTGGSLEKGGAGGPRICSALRCHTLAHA
jgi:hypothetical protein